MKKFLLSLAAVALTVSASLANTVSITWSAMGYTNGEVLSDITGGINFDDNIVNVTFKKNSNANPPAYYNTGTAARLYGGNSMVVSVAEGYKLESIVFTVGSSNKFNANTTATNGTLSDLTQTTVTWTATGDVTSTEITQGGTSGHVRISETVITYSAAGSPDLLAAEVAFPQNAYTVALGSTFDAPVATAATNAPITYTSSATDVATVNATTGAVTILAAGTTTIKAIAEANDTYNAGQAEYTLTVLNAFNSLADMLLATTGDKGIVTFPMTVTYQNGINTYVMDADNVMLIYGTMPTYEAGDVIPAGWQAEYSPYRSLPEVKPLTQPEASTSNVGFTPEDVTAVNLDMVNEIVMLKNVNFEEATPSATKTSFTGTADGVSYTFRTNFAIDSTEAGDYDVLVAVGRFDDGLQLYPLSYNTPTGTGIESVEAQDGEARWFNLQGVETARPESGICIRVQNGKAVKVIVK